MADGKLYVRNAPVVPIDDWTIPGAETQTFSGSMQPRDDLPKFVKGMTMIFNDRNYTLTWVRDWNGYRKGKRIKPRTVYFYAQDVCDA